MRRLFLVCVLTMFLVLTAGFQSNCPGRSDPNKAARSAEEQFALYTDRVAEYIGRGMALTDFLVTGNTITPARGTVIVEALEKVNAANKALILGGQAFVVQVEGKRILRFTEDGRLELEKLANATEAAAINALKNPALLQLDPTARSQLTALITPARIAATRVLSIIKNARKITVVNPAAIEIELSYERSIEMGGVGRVRLAAI